MIDFVQTHNWDLVAVTGKDFTDLPENIMQFDSAEQIASWYRDRQFENATVLIKGSRSMAMRKK